MPTILFDAVSAAIEPLRAKVKRRPETLADAVLRTICYLEAENIIDGFSTRDLAESLRDGGIPAINTPELAEAHLLNVCTDIYPDGNVYRNDAYKTDEGWEGYIERVQRFWKEKTA